MKEIIKPVYYCEHEGCKKHGLSKHQMIYHEKICTKNPENFRPCFRRTYLIKKEAVVECYTYDGGSYDVKLDLLYCDSKKHFLYTPKNEIKKNMYELGYEFNNPMPKECLSFKTSSLYA